MHQLLVFNLFYHVPSFGLILQPFGRTEHHKLDGACALVSTTSKQSHFAVSDVLRSIEHHTATLFAGRRSTRAFESRHQCGPEPTIDAAMSALDASTGGRVTPEDVNRAFMDESVGLHFAIRKGKLSYNVSSGKRHDILRDRVGAYASLLQDILNEVDLPDMEFAMSIMDRSAGPSFVFKTEGTPGKDLLLVPRSLADWGHLPQRLAAESMQKPCVHKKQTAIFRGATTGGKHRWNANVSEQHLLDFNGEPLPRYQVVALSRSRPDLLDAGFTRVVQADMPQLFLESLKAQGMMRDVLSDDEQRCHAAVVVVDGNSLPDRLPRQLAYGVPVVFLHEQIRHQQFDEFWYNELRPGVDYVRATPDTLSAVLEKLRARPDVARCIGQNGRRFVMKHLSESRLKCYSHRLLSEYAKRYHGSS
jgi:hypothetical protein